MRETRPSGSEGGARSIPCPYPYRFGCGKSRAVFFRGYWFQYTKTNTAACSADFTTSSNFRSFVSGSFNFADTSGTDS